MTRQLTGRHVALIIVAFFGVVIAVNVLMATLAVKTFGGVVVENSYVASQEFNRWLAQARAQEQLGWTIDPGVAPDRRVTVSLSVAGAEVSGVARHPLGRQPEVPLRFHAERGQLISDRPLPAGRWAVHLVVRKGGQEARVTEMLA
jgi:nitrogen fixation protein FixH